MSIYVSHSQLDGLNIQQRNIGFGIKLSIDVYYEDHQY